MGVAKIEEALEDLKQGKMVVLVDDESRENEGTVCLIKLPTVEKRKEYIVIRAEHFLENYNRSLEK